MRYGDANLELVRLGARIERAEERLTELGFDEAAEACAQAHAVIADARETITAQAVAAVRPVETAAA